MNKLDQLESTCKPKLQQHKAHINLSHISLRAHEEISRTLLKEGKNDARARAVLRV